ncbi:MAG: biotin/lipoyl-binding protein, partial [Beijerinckiaceae bacterium]
MLDSPKAPELKAPDTASPETVTASPPKERRTGLVLLVSLIAAVLLGGGIYHGIRGRTAAEAALAAETRGAAEPIVDIIHPKTGAPDQALVLPGQTMAFRDTPIYARASGYLKQWYFDIGAHVKKGQLLAEIETPELDQQLRQARADLATAEANAKLAKITLDRAAALVQRGAVSVQTRDNAT